MKRLLALATLTLTALPALAVGRLADVTILDRDRGDVLPTYYYRGEYWVAGAPGARYSIKIRNHDGGRMLAIVAVDGVNAITGETAGWEQSGYVFDSLQGYDITGWRKSNQEVAQFVFAAAPESYAARTGRAANLGVIGVAVFRERQRPVAMVAPATAGAVAADAARERSASPPAAGVLSSPSVGTSVPRQPPAPAAKLGTGHGEREQSTVVDVEFERQSSSPDEVIRIRYDSRENLVALGVIRARPVVPPGPNPFPGSPAPGFVPDPPAYPAQGLR